MGGAEDEHRANPEDGPDGIVNLRAPGGVAGYPRPSPDITATDFPPAIINHAVGSAGGSST